MDPENPFDDPWDSRAKPNPFPSLGEEWSIPRPSEGYAERLNDTAAAVATYAEQQALAIYLSIIQR